MSSPDTKEQPKIGFVVPTITDSHHGFPNPMAENPAAQPSTNPSPAPPPYSAVGPAAPYPTSPYSSAYPNHPYPAPSGPTTDPYSSPSKAPAGPYPPPSGPPVGPYSPYPHQNPTGGSSYPGSPGFNSMGDPLIADFRPNEPKDSSTDSRNESQIPFADGSMESPFSDKNIRRQFMKKVYAILMLQLTITFGFVFLCIYNKGISEPISRNPNYIFIAFGVTFATLIPMVCCDCARRTFPQNFIFLMIFTLAQAFVLGVVSIRYDPDSVIIAIGITMVVCLSLTLFAFQTKYDFTGCGGALLVMLVVFTLMGFVLIFFPGEKKRVLYGAAGALLFSLYLIYDTQLIMGGSHKYSISPEEYIFAALNIYLDIINLFLYILSILGKKK